MMPYIIYANTESLIKVIDGCANNPENSSKIKTGQHISCVYSISKIWEFDHIEKDCMKKFCTSKRKHAKNIIDLKRKKKCYR